MTLFPIRRVSLILAGTLAACAGPALAQEDDEDGLSVLWKDGEISGQARYRYERADQDGFAQNANASTVRLKATVETGEYKGVKFLVEGEGVTQLGLEDFNSTQNGNVAFPVVADPSFIELNRAQVQVDVHERVDVTVGRQRIQFGNERFVGNVGFRQDEQTFDAIRVDAEPHERLRLTLVGGNRVNTIFGSTNNPVPAVPPAGLTTPPSGTLTGNFVLSNAEADLTDTIKATAYGHNLDFNESPALSTRTIGGRLDGDHDVGGGVVLGWTGEYAYQTNTNGNPVDIDLFYARGEGRMRLLYGTLNGGVEVLDGNGTVGFSTPLSTLHKFNGLADVFLVTPAVGLRDFFVGWTSDIPAVGPVRAMQAKVTLHSFASEDGAIDLGEEIDAIVRARFNEHVATAVQYAHYASGNTPASPADISRLWFTLDLRY